MAATKIPCTVCRKPARARKSPFDSHHRFDCAVCGTFEVSEAFIAEARHQPIGARRNALQNAIARARYGQIPIVTTYDLP
jgi:hypothetical protein